MEIHLAGSRPTRRAPKEYFTGTVLAGSDHPDRGAGAAGLQPRLLRARRAHGVAHPSARPDAVRHLRRRPGPGQGRPDPGDQAR